VAKREGQGPRLVKPPPRRDSKKKTYLVRVESVDDQAHQLRNLSLESEGLGLARHVYEMRKGIKKSLVKVDRALFAFIHDQEKNLGLPLKKWFTVQVY